MQYWLHGTLGMCGMSGRESRDAELSLLRDIFRCNGYNWSDINWAMDHRSSAVTQVDATVMDEMSFDSLLWCSIRQTGEIHVEVAFQTNV